MAPSKIMILRHAEKPEGVGPKGVRADGVEDAHSLTTRGWQRAGALVRLLAPHGDVFVHPGLARPESLYATRHDPKAASATRRPRQTIEPLAEFAGLAIDDRFAKQEEAKLVADVMRGSGIVLIAWAHELIPAIIAALPNAPPTPHKWPDDRFDLVWIFDAAPDGGWTFAQVPQMLLAGDRDEPIL